ncbi:MAG: phosphatidate cytidylyltransferase [Gemmatimonadota bacterium]
MAGLRGGGLLRGRGRLPAPGAPLRPGPAIAKDAALPVRVLSAAVLAPAFLAAAWVGGPVFVVVVAGLAALGAREYCRLLLPGEPAALALVLGAALAAVGGRYAAPVGGGWVEVLVSAATVGALLLGLRAGSPAAGLRTATLALLGALYVGWLFSFLVGLRELPRALPLTPYRGGLALVLAPLLLTWTTDVAAYFVGRAWGRRRLLPHISPGKTLAGAVGAVLCAALVGAALFAWAPGALPRLGWAAGAVAGAVASVLAQAGDLAESLLKRAAGAKDSGALIPGHGGVLDRFDAVLFTAPAAYALFLGVLG